MPEAGELVIGGFLIRQIWRVDPKVFNSGCFLYLTDFQITPRRVGNRMMKGQTAVAKRSGWHLNDRIGHTPLLRLGRLAHHFGDIDIKIKAEWMNTTGSIKDRPASRIVRIAEERGILKQHHILLDASSGNFGISLAMVGAARGFRVKVCMPSSIPVERRRLFEAFSAELILTDAAQGSDGAMLTAREIAASDKEQKQYFYTDQYSNSANWEAHYYETAEEIWSQTHGRITHFVACLGSGGTVMGVSRRLHELDPSIKCIAVQPDRADHKLRGMKHMESVIQPAIYDPSELDAVIHVSTREAWDAMRQLWHREGLFVGPTSGAALAACSHLAKTSPRPERIVVVFADSGMNYLSELDSFL